MFNDYKSVIIVILLFFLFRKSTSCECEDKDLDTFIDENDDVSASNGEKPKCEIVINEFTERKFEQNLDDIKDYYGYD